MIHCISINAMDITAKNLFINNLYMLDNKYYREAAVTLWILVYTFYMYSSPTNGIIYMNHCICLCPMLLIHNKLYVDGFFSVVKYVVTYCSFQSLINIKVHYITCFKLIWHNWYIYQNKKFGYYGIIHLPCMFP